MFGIFDSGSGGLTVLKEIKKLLPKADIIYFGDLKNAPYGNKTPEEIGALTALGFQKLIKEGASNIVSACNSASANLILPLLNDLKIKPENIIEMVGPTMRAFREKQNARILLVATEATIRSGIYQNAFESAGIKLQTLAMPHLAGAIEGGTSQPALLAMIGSALEKYNGTYDTLILACTHFPLVIDLFRRNVPKDVLIFDPAEVVAKEAVNKYKNNGEKPFSNSRELEKGGGGNLRFLISKDSLFFRGKVDEFFGNSDYKIDVVR